MPRPGVVTHADALRRARRRVAWWCLRAVLGASFLVFMAFALVVGSRTEDEHQALLDSAPRTVATVVDVRPGRWSPEIDVDVEGRTEALALGFPGDHRTQVGDVVEVVVDPDDPQLVLPVAGHDDAVWSPLGSAVLTAGIAALSLLVGVPLVLVPGPRRLRAAARPRVVLDGTVVDAQDDVVTFDADGVRWTWSGSDGWRPRRGKPVVVLGDLRDGGLVLLDDGRSRWPAAPLGRATGGTAD